MDYADTNFVVAAYFETLDFTDAVERFLRRQREPLLIGELTELESRGIFCRREGRSGGAKWLQLVTQLDSGNWRRQAIEWPLVSARAAQLFDRFGPKFTTGSFDTLHVAAALEAGCARFLSFDSTSNARVLAASARLKVWPELSAAEKARVVR